MEYSKDKFQQTQNYSQETLTKPRMRGLELRDEEKVWNGVAASECRIGLMEMMIGKSGGHLMVILERN